MADNKVRRQRRLAELLRTQRFASQEELATELAAAGFSATQATVSRDLDDLGAVKLRRDGRTVYSLPGDPAEPDWAGKRVAAIFRDWVRSVDAAGNLVVIKTPPGSAHLVGVALDQAPPPGVVGTICGDDTIFLAVRDAKAAAGLAKSLGAL